MKQMDVILSGIGSRLLNSVKFFRSYRSFFWFFNSSISVCTNSAVSSPL